MRQGFANLFLSDIVTVLDHCGHHIGLQTQYSIDAFSRSLFDIYEVDFPTRLGNAVPKRQGEFLAGRVLAGAALKSLGVLENSVGIGERAPLYGQRVLLARSVIPMADARASSPVAKTC